MESIIAVDMKSFRFSHNPISDHEFGFRPGHSTLDMLLQLTQRWMDILSVRQEKRVVSLDIQYLMLLIQSGILPSSPKGLLMVSKANSTHGLLTSSTLIANVWQSTESFHLLALSRKQSPKAVFWVQSYSHSSSVISLTLWKSPFINLLMTPPSVMTSPVL